MQIRIAAVGRLRDPAIAEIVGRYIKRCQWPIEILELLPKGRQTEVELLERSCRDCDRLVALDERGKQQSSCEFARQLGSWFDDGCRRAVFLIGGADGLDPSLCQRADLILAFGRATWPHMLVRAMLTEQIYRASCILSGHPYHRDG